MNEAIHAEGRSACAGQTGVIGAAAVSHGSCDEAAVLRVRSHGAGTVNPNLKLVSRCLRRYLSIALRRAALYRLYPDLLTVVQEHLS